MTLSIAEQGMVEILRGLMRHSEILILDEPTSALTFDEVQSLFKVVQELKQKNIGIIYITHRLAEVFEISTSIGILRDGVMAMRGKVEDFTREDLVRGLLQRLRKRLPRAQTLITTQSQSLSLLSLRAMVLQM